MQAHNSFYNLFCGLHKVQISVPLGGASATFSDERVTLDRSKTFQKLKSENIIIIVTNYPLRMVVLNVGRTSESLREL